MFPVLFSVGGLSVSSFGVFLALGFLLGIFLIWRLSRAWDLDEEKVLDLILLTFIGGMIGARVFFTIENWQYFISSPLNVILVNQVPGFSFWGGFLGGWLILYFFARRKRLDFWQLADIASVGLLGGLILSDLGCLLGSCNIGTVSNSFFAVTQVGIIGRRWPIQAIEALLLFVGLLRIWFQATHFHQRGKIISSALILIGVIKLILEPIKQNHTELMFPVLFIFLGFTIFYRATKQSPVKHFKGFVKNILRFFTDPKNRTKAIQNLRKEWYNQKVNIRWKLRSFKKLLRRSNVKFS